MEEDRRQMGEGSSSRILAGTVFPVALMFAGLTACFSVGIGRVSLFDWDEINFAESAREMLVTGDFLNVRIDFKPFHEKPPLFFWLQAASMKMFGVGEWAARFPNAVCGALSILCAIFWGRRLARHSTRIADREAGLEWLWGLALFGSFLPHVYFKSGIIDPWFNLFIFGSIVALFEMTRAVTGGAILFPFRPNTGGGEVLGWTVLAGGFAGLAVLTKGPVALLLVALTGLLHLVGMGLRHRLSARHWRDLALLTGLFGIVATGLGFSWHALIFSSGGGGLLEEFWDYQLRLLKTGDAGHGQPWYYHPLVLAFGCFPASFFLFPSLSSLRAAGFARHPGRNGRAESSADEGDSAREEFRVLMWILFWVVVVVFSAVRTKIVHYSSLAWLPMSFLAADRMRSLLARGDSLSRTGFFGLLILALPLALASMVVPLLGLFPHRLEPFLEDPFVKMSFLGANPWPWQGWEFLPGALWLAVTVGIGLRARHAAWSRLVFGTWFGASGLFAALVFVVLAPRIERHTQGPLIDFLKAHPGERVELNGMRSYAPYFYGDRGPDARTREVSFVIARAGRDQKLREKASGWSFHSNQGGYVVFEPESLKKSDSIEGSEPQ